MREENNRENDHSPRRVSRHSGTGRYGARDDGKRESIREFEANGDPTAAGTRAGAKNASAEQSGQNPARREKESDPHANAQEENAQNGGDGTARGKAAESESGTPKRSPRHPAPPKPYRPAGDPDRFVHQIIPYVMFWVALFAAVSFILRDLCGMGESAGAFGNKFADLLCGLIGAAAYLLPLFLVVLALRWKHFVETGLLVRKLVLSGAFLWLLSGIVHVFEDKTGRGVRVMDAATLYADGKVRAGGGVVGGFLGEWMGFTLRLPGTCLLAIPLLVIIGIYLVGLTPRGLWQRISRKLHLEERQRGKKAGSRAISAKAPAASVTEGSTPAGGALGGGAVGTLPSADDGWCEPQPLTRSQTPLQYDFAEEGARQPFRTVKQKTAGGERPTVSEELAAAFGTENVLDIPEDEPELSEVGQEAGGVGGSEKKPSLAYSPFVPAGEQPGGRGYPVGGTPAKEPTVGGANQTVQSGEAAASHTPAEQADGFSPFSLPRNEEPKNWRPEGDGRERNTVPRATAGTPEGDYIPPEGYSPFGIRREIPSETGEKAGHSVPSTGYSPFGIHRDLSAQSPAPAKEPREGETDGDAPTGASVSAPVNGFSPFGIHQNHTEGSIGNAGGQGAFGRADYERRSPSFGTDAAHGRDSDILFEEENAEDELFAGDFAAGSKPSDAPHGRAASETDDGYFGLDSGRSAAKHGEDLPTRSDEDADLGDEDDPIPDEISFARPATPAFRTATRATVTETSGRQTAFGGAYPTDHAAPAFENGNPAGTDTPDPHTAEPRTPEPRTADFHTADPRTAGGFSANGTVRAVAESVREPVRARTEPVRQEPPAHTPAPVRAFVKPPLTLLNEDHQNKDVDHTEEIEAKKEALRATLASFNVRIKEEIECSRGPTITRYELRPEIGTSVRSVTSRIDDISLNMAARVRIEAPIPGKPAIGIEVPNAERETVYMRTLLESPEYKNSKKPLEVPLGIGIGGNVEMCDLAKMPHLLVAGTTGSGKSVCINTMLVGLMYKTPPEDLRLVLIDPKQVEFSLYEHVPHLYMPIVTDMKRAVGVLACAVAEMDRRYALMRDVGVRDIDGYNEAVKNDPEREHLPRMVIVIDEFADLKMSVTNNDPETFTCRLAQKARAAGIHLIIGTQRPSVDVITGKLKVNIPSRIAFTVMQQVDSRTILDANGAEALTGRGDMLYMPVGVQKPARVQGAFVSDGEIDRVVTYIREHNETVHYNQAFMDQLEVEMARAESANRKQGDDDFDDDGDSGEDAIFNKAVRLAVESQKVATSLLQRRLSIGYGRAAKLIDRMEELGIVSAAEGNKPRRVLITAEQYAARIENDGGFSDDTDDFI